MQPQQFAACCDNFIYKSKSVYTLSLSPDYLSIASLRGNLYL